MKPIRSNIFAMIVLSIIFVSGTASAGEWVRVFEMGESGVVVEFPVALPDKKLDLGDAVIARKPSVNAASRVR